MKRICAGCGKEIGPGEVAVIEVAGEGYRHRYHSIGCWDWELTEHAAQLSGELLPFLPNLKLASELRLRETEAPTFVRGVHAAAFPSL